MIDELALTLITSQRSALADIHALVNNSPPSSNNQRSADLFSNRYKDNYDEEDNPVDDEDILQTLRTEMQKEKESILKPPIAQPTEDKKKDNAAETKPAPSASASAAEKSVEQQAAENVAKALAIENAKLKAELSAFDADFFEELEDLKLKYSELQVSFFFASLITYSFTYLSLTYLQECCFRKTFLSSLSSKIQRKRRIKHITNQKTSFSSNHWKTWEICQTICSCINQFE